MQIAHDTVVLVADGRKLLFLRNEGDGAHPNLVVENAQEHADAGTADQGTDRPGRTQSSVGPGRNSYEQADWHQIEEDRFAAEAADMLKRRAFANDYEKLIVVAPPRTLGELRKHYHAEVEKRLVGEIDKDLTGHPIADIERALGNA